MSVQTIKSKHHTEIRLNRPEKRNALSCELMRNLIDTLDMIRKDSDQRAILIRGEGQVFCSGLDLQEIADQSVARKSAKCLSELLQVLYTYPLVTICGVHGASVAGGAALMSACDIVIAEENTQIGFPEVRRGIVAGFVSALLMKQMRVREIKELLLIGEPVSAKRALEMGLVTKIFSADTFESGMEDIVDKVLRGAPQTMRLSKELLEKLDPSPMEHSWRIAESFHLQSRASGEAKEGARAFLEKRKPKWVGK